MAVGSMILRLAFSATSRIETDRFQVGQVAPRLARKIGERISSEQIVSAFADPVWTMQLHVGPLPTAEGVLLRGAVGSFLTVQIEDTAARARPAAGIWIGPAIHAELLDVMQRPLGSDITRGERYELRLQFLQSRIGA